MARLSGQVPLVGIVSGRCFAGNAAFLGICDVIIATRNASIGMGGPAMISGGGLGDFDPDEIGPTAVQVANGVVDIEVADEREAAAVARQYLSYFQGIGPQWTCADQTALRDAIPADRKRAYDVRPVITTLADTGSVLELRAGWGPGVVTCLARIEGRPLGIVANNPHHLGGAIDAEAAQKAARFLRLCDAHGLPVVTLCDTPGFMVGPEAERTATVRHFGRLFVTGANLGVPNVTVVLRKAYGLGAQAMATGTFTAPTATIAWPTGEIGAMGLEGAVKLGYRRELDSAEDRDALLDQLIARAYEHSKALNIASVFEIDDVIDPADTRRWILAAIRTNVGVRDRRRYVDPW
jgi:acetyl-CoA carboxylase carboxyltransferase component